MHHLTLTPQGFFQGIHPIDIKKLTPKPVLIHLEGFPMDFTYQSLEGLSFLERYQYLKTYERTTCLQDTYFFLRHAAKAWVSVKIPHKVLQGFLDTLDALHFPIKGVCIQALEDARFFKEPTVHIQQMAKNTLRLLYVYKGLPCLVRYVPYASKSQEIQATLEYIQQTFDAAAPKVTEEPLKKKRNFHWFKTLPGANRFWTFFIWRRLTSACLGTGIILGLFLGIYSIQQEKILSEAMAKLQNHTLKLEKLLATFPKETCEELYHMAITSQPYIQSCNQRSWQEAYERLHSIAPLGLLQDVVWQPNKDLKLLVSFNKWREIEPFQKALQEKWPSSSIQRLKNQDNREGILVQWHISH